MFSHERFRELSALAAIGQLSKEEERELEDHLRECASCRDARDDYARVVRHFPPQLEGIAAGGFETSSQRERFFSRVRNQGVNLSMEAELATPVRSGPSFHARRPALRGAMGQFVQVIEHRKAVLSAVALVMIVFSAVWFSRVERGGTRAPAAQIGRVGVATQNDGLREELAGLREQIAKQAGQLEDSQKALAALRESRRKLEQQRAQLSSQTSAFAAALRRLEADNSVLSHMNEANDASIAVLRADNERIADERRDYLKTKQVLAAHLADVTDKLAEKETTLERERELMTATDDVFKLLGARNMHILDVHDLDETGRSVKSFGRVFYAENQAFVFYAFDLPNGGLNAAGFTFRAWGQRDTVSYSPRKLGTFEVDSHEPRRWVMQLKDPALLAGMDYVFVTAEPRYDVEEPRGRKLLMAYIGGQPNHP